MEPIAIFIAREEPVLPTPEQERSPALGKLKRVEGLNHHRVANKESLQKMNGIGDVDFVVVIDIGSRPADQGTPLVKEIIQQVLGITDLEAVVTIHIPTQRGPLLGA